MNTWDPRGIERGRKPAGAAPRNGLLLAALLTAQLLLMSASTRGDTGSRALQSWFMRLSWPGVAAARVVTSAFDGVAGRARELFAVRRRNEVLEAEVRRLAEDLVHSREAEPENRRLRRLLDMREAMVPRSMVATILTSYVDGQTGMIVVDRGARDGLRPDLPVVAWGGVVGRVVQVGPAQAKIRLLIDANSGAGGVVQRSRAQGIAVGGHDGRIDLKYVAGHEDVALGDRVVSSGLDGIFPRGFGIGRVTGVTSDPDGSQTYHLQPELDFRALEEVLVLLDCGGEEPTGSADLEDQAVLPAVDAP